MGMDAEFKGLVLTFVIDASLFAFAYLVFRMRKKHVKRKQQRLAEDDEHVDLLSNQPQQPLPDLFARPDDYRLNQPLVFKMLFSPLNFGQDSTLFLRFQQVAISVLLFMSFMVLTVVLPVNLSSSNPILNQTWLHMSSTGNLPLGDPKLWVIFAVILICTFVALGMVIFFMKDIRKLVSPWRQRKKLESRTVHVSGIRGDVTDERLMAHYQEIFPEYGAVVFAHVVEDVRRVRKLISQRDDIGNKIELLRNHLHEANDGANEEAILRLEADLREKREQIQEEKQKPRWKTGHAFVGFKNAQTATNACMFRSSTVLDDSNWSVTLAPAPSDIIWDNISSYPNSIMWRLRYLLINLGLFLLMVLIIAPVTVLDRITPLVFSFEDQLQISEENVLRGFIAT